MTGIVPDLVYLDADKKGHELELCHRLFPHAVLTGDDWWYEEQGTYPIREPVLRFCRAHDKYLRTAKMTWVIDDAPPSVAYRLSRPF